MEDDRIIHLRSKVCPWFIAVSQYEIFKLIVILRELYNSNRVISLWVRFCGEVLLTVVDVALPESRCAAAQLLRNEHFVSSQNMAVRR